MDIFRMIFVYFVEIRHPRTTQWVTIHSLEWETTESYADARIYAQRVRDDHPDSRVRIVENVPELPIEYIEIP